MRKTLSCEPHPLNKVPPPDAEPPKILGLLYVRGSEKVERVCAPLGVKTAFKPMRTMRQTLTKIKIPIPEVEK